MQHEKIHACIMAGGKGTRLRPLTSKFPKPQAELLGKPIVNYILELLAKHNVSNAKLAVGYHGEKLEQALEDYASLDLDFIYEEIPLGTAGAVKNAMKGETDDFIVISGDAMCDMDLSAAYEFHKANNSMVTVISTRVADPREYGLVLCEPDGKVVGFIEKPSYHSCSVDLASTGIYIMSPQILDLIAENTSVDFASSVFPEMLIKGLPIYTYEDNGYWCDIGDFKSYIKCQKDMLSGKVKCKIDADCTNGIYHRSPLDIKELSVGSPCYIGEGVTIGKSSVIGEDCVICDGVTIGNDSVITASVLLNGVYVGSDVDITNSVCCSGSRFCDGSSVLEGCVIGSDAVIEKGAIVSDSVRVWSNKIVPAGSTLTEDLHFGTARDIFVDDDGITGQTNIKITPELCVKIGSSVASLKNQCIVGVGYSSQSCSLALYYAVSAGVMAAGGTVWSFGVSVENQFQFCLAKSMADYGIFIDGGNMTKIKLYEKGGLSTCRATERKIEGNINRMEFKRIIPSKTGTIVDMTSLIELYKIELLKQCDHSLDLLSVNVKCGDKHTKKLLEDTLTQLGCEIGEGITITLCTNGGLMLYDMETTIDSSTSLCLVCLAEFMRDENVYIAECAPRIIDALATEHNAKVFRYPECPCDQKQLAIRQKAINKPFLRDELMMTIKLLSFMKERKLTLKELNELIPPFDQSNRLIPIDRPPSTILKNLKCDKSPLSEGLRLTHNGRTAIIKPLKSGDGIMIFAEVLKKSQSETALEICDIFEDIIKNSTLDS